jgi:hypothetical protein
MLRDDGLSVRENAAPNPALLVTQARIAYRHALRTLALDAAGLAKLDCLRASLWEAEIDAAN